MCHEFDVHFHFAADGLKPYYALDSIRKDWGDRWRSEGKPTAGFEFNGTQWKTTLDYDSQPLQPWRDSSYRLESTPLFRAYFVACDELYDGERPDQSQRIRGGTITVRPRWPEMRKENGRKVRGYMDLGKPYLDVQVQASNIDFEDYLELVRVAFGALGVSPSYIRDPEPSSNINDAAVYVRIRRGESGWAFDRIYQYLAYKGKMRGVEVLKENEWDTSKTCSNCGDTTKSNRVERGLYVRSSCELVGNADCNGAENMRQKI